LTRSTSRDSPNRSIKFVIIPKPVREVSAMCMQAGRLWDFGPWYCFVGARRPSRREKTEELKDYIAELKEALEEAEERLKELET
jgi:hypothetical protein